MFLINFKLYIQAKLAQDMIYCLFEIDKMKYPYKNDFNYFIKFQGKDFTVVYTNDVNVTVPNWHMSVEEVIK